MTNQGFYEYTVKTTISSGLNPKFAEIFRDCDVEDISFSEICVKLNLHGFNIPEKADFSKWGKGYLVQLFGFAHSCGDDGYVKEFFSFIEKKSIIRMISGDKEFGEFLYSLYYDNIQSDQEYAKYIAHLLINYFTEIPSFEKFRKLVRGLGIIHNEDIDFYFGGKLNGLL